tara:strand:+ start:48 stop:224 length:177 start_codon:yes stop_codon:yes gene_type:complete
MTQNRKTKHQNFVAKNMEKFNRPVTHLDKKKQSKINGYTSDLVWIDELDEITGIEKKL